MCRPVTLRTSRPWRNSLCTLSQGRPRLRVQESLERPKHVGEPLAIGAILPPPARRYELGLILVVGIRNKWETLAPLAVSGECCRRAPAQPPLCSCLYALPESLLKRPKTPVEVLLLSPGNMREENRLEVGLCGNPALRGNAPRSLPIPAFPQISSSAGFAGPAS